MKIVCDNCATKYSIADEKVRGKVFKIRCKKCSHVIVVRGGEGAAAQADGAGGAPDLGADDGESTMASGAIPQSVANVGAGDAVWHLVINGEQVGPMTNAEVRGKVAAGQVDVEAFAWREGFGDWLRLGSIDDFKDLGAAAAAPAAEAPEGATRRTDAADVFASHQAAHAGDDDGGAADLFGGVAATAASPAPTARPTARGGDDLFGAVTAAPSGGAAAAGYDGGHENGHDHGSNGAGASGGGAKLTGQRNENSVLFSLNNLQALATGKGGGAQGGSGANGGSNGSAAPAARPGYASASTEGSGLIDIRAMAAQTLSAAPSTSSVPGELPGANSAPVFSPVVAAPILMPTASSGTPKWVFGLIAGAVVLVLGVVAVLVVVLTRKPEYPPGYVLPPGAVAVPGTPGAPAAPGQVAVATPTAPAQPGTSAPAPTTAGTQAAAPSTAAPSAPVADEGSSKHGKHEKGGHEKKGASSGAHESPSASSPAPSAPAPVESRPAPSKPKKGGDDLDSLLEGAAPSKAPAPRASSRAEAADDPNLPDQLSRGDVQAGMSSVNGRAKACYGQYHVGGTALAKVVIGKNGRVSSVNVQGIFAGTPTGDCVAKAVKGASFKKFKGSDMSVTYPFILP